MNNLEEARRLWIEYVPDNGPAHTVQGELLRAVESLRDEAMRNGNVNWSDSHRASAAFLLRYLTTCGLFGPDALDEIANDIQRALDFNRPAGDDVYDRLADRVVEWCRVQSAPVPM